MQRKIRDIAGNPLVSFHLDQRERRVVPMECRTALVDRFPDRIREQYDEKYEVTAAADSTVDELEAKFSACPHLDPTRVRAW